MSASTSKLEMSLDEIIKAQKGKGNNSSPGKKPSGGAGAKIRRSGGPINKRRQVLMKGGGGQRRSIGGGGINKNRINQGKRLNITTIAKKRIGGPIRRGVPRRQPIVGGINRRFVRKNVPTGGNNRAMVSATKNLVKKTRQESTRKKCGHHLIDHHGRPSRQTGSHSGQSSASTPPNHDAESNQCPFSGHWPSSTTSTHCGHAPKSFTNYSSTIGTGKCARPWPCSICYCPNDTIGRTTCHHYSKTSPPKQQHHSICSATTGTNCIPISPTGSTTFGPWSNQCNAPGNPCPTAEHSILEATIPTGTGRVQNCSSTAATNDANDESSSASTSSATGNHRSTIAQSTAAAFTTPPPTKTKTATNTTTNFHFAAGTNWWWPWSSTTTVLRWTQGRRPAATWSNARWWSTSHSTRSNVCAAKLSATHLKAK